MQLAHFDQGPMGHVRRKPTMLASNFGINKQLDGERGRGIGKGLMKTVEERLKSQRHGQP